MADMWVTRQTMRPMLWLMMLMLLRAMKMRVWHVWLRLVPNAARLRRHVMGLLHGRGRGRCRLELGRLLREVVHALGEHHARLPCLLLD